MESKIQYWLDLSDYDLENSDIDIAIVVDHLEGDYFDIHPLLFKLRRQIDNRIEPVLIGQEHDDAGLLVEITKSGIAIV